MKKAKKVLALFLALSMLMSVMVFTSASAEGPDEMTISAVNFEPVWGDKEANIAAMTELVKDAAAEGSDLILFPEMCVTGYSTGMEYLPGSDVPMSVELAEEIPGPTSQYFSQLAAEYDIYIVYGATEVIPDDDEHAYNVAVACSPDGTVDSYEKIHPYETDWCVAGTEPTYFQTEWGPVGLSICYDTYATPELARLYAASGCKLLLNPTALTDAGDWGWDWYYQNRLEFCATVNNMYVASANLVGKDGPNGIRHFPGGALVMGPADTENPDRYNDYIDYYAGGIYNESQEVVTATVDMTLAKNTNLKRDIFQPNLYAEWYSELTDLYENGFIVPEPEVTTSPVCAVVNFNPVWGDKDANLSLMKGYIEDAAAQNVDILVFPEMALTDYASSSDPASDEYKMPLEQATTTDSYWAKEISAQAAEHDMYIVYGTAEVNPEDAEHPYNSAFTATPDGDTISYRKIQPVEGAWCTSGTEPVIIDTPWGGMGLSICMDTYMYPELERYYAAKGCRILVNPTASGGYARKGHVYCTTLSAIANRDGMTVLSADLVGESGPESDIFDFPGKSVIVGYASGGVEYYNEMTDVEGMYVASPDMSSTGFSVFLGFKPAAFAEGYAKLAAGEPIYVTPAVAEPDESSSTPDSSTALESSETTPNTGVADAASGFVIGGIALAVMFGCFGISFAYRKKEGRQK